MGGLREEIVSTQFPEAITFFPKQAQIPGKCRGVAGDIDDVRDVEADYMLKPFRADARPRRV